MLTNDEEVKEAMRELREGIGREYPLNLLDETFGENWEEETGTVPPDLRGSVEYVLWLTCTPREVEMIHSRYEYEYSYRSIAAIENISAERARQIVKSVQRKLRLRDNAEILKYGVNRKIKQSEVMK